MTCPCVGVAARSPPPSYAAATAATAAPAGSPPDPGRPAEGPATAPATEGPGPFVSGRSGQPFALAPVMQNPWVCVHVGFEVRVGVFDWQLRRPEADHCPGVPQCVTFSGLGKHFL